jgi:MoaA/NifB/PqqE/SkfB family radical SAM enzyme
MPDHVKQFSSDKILNHTERVNEWVHCGTTAPVTVEIDMTNVCNNKCPNCFGFYGDTDRDASISYDDAMEIIDQIAIIGGKALTFTGGGEPLCNKDTPDAIVSATWDYGLDTALITNGLLLDEGTIRKILPHLTWIRVSLDAATPAVYEKTHGLGEKAFFKVVENTRTLVRVKKELGLDATVGVGYLVGEDTVGEIVEAAELCKDMGVDYIQYRPFLRLPGTEEIDYDKTDPMAHIEKALELAAPGFDVLYSKHKYDSMQAHECRPYKKCYGHHFATVIAANRCMYICCHMRGFEQYMIGDLKKDKLMKIWYSARRREVYENINFKDCPPLCRCNTFNEILWNIAQEKKHVNFL